MSDQITPIQRDAAGATTFEKVQTIEIKTPDNAAPPAGKNPPCCGSEDGLNFSRPMKSFLMTKKSYFVAPPPASDVQKQKREKEALQPDSADQARVNGQNQLAGSLLSIIG